MALAPWAVVAQGKLRTDAEEEQRRQTGEKGRTISNPNWERNEDEKKMSAALEKVAKEVGSEHITAGNSDSYVRSFKICENLTVLYSSRYRISDAKNAICLPYYRGKKGRASHGQRRGSGHFSHSGADCLSRERDTF